MKLYDHLHRKSPLYRTSLHQLFFNYALCSLNLSLNSFLLQWTIKHKIQPVKFLKKKHERRRMVSMKNIK